MKKAILAIIMAATISFAASAATKAEFAGGLILILLGAKILLEHLFF